MRKDVEIPKQHPRTSARKQKLEGRRVFFPRWTMTLGLTLTPTVLVVCSGPEKTTNMVAKWLQDNALCVLGRPSQRPDLSPVGSAERA